VTFNSKEHQKQKVTLKSTIIADVQ